MDLAVDTGKCNRQHSDSDKAGSDELGTTSQMCSDQINSIEVDSQLLTLCPWLPVFMKQAINSIGANGITELEKLMSDYYKYLSGSVEKCYLRPIRAAILKQSIRKFLLFFNQLNNNLPKYLDHSTYLEKMSDLLAFYIDMEIRASRRGKEDIAKIGSRIIMYLYQLLENSHDYILDSILKTKLITKKFGQLSSVIMSRVLRDSPARYLSEVTYIRYILVYKLWKKMTSCPDEKDSIVKKATKELWPPFNFKETLKRSFFCDVLPKIPKSVTNITLFLLQAKFLVEEKTKVFFKVISDPKKKYAVVTSDSSELERLVFLAADCSEPGQECTDRNNLTLNNIWSNLHFQHDDDRLVDAVCAKYEVKHHSTSQDPVDIRLTGKSNSNDDDSDSNIENDNDGFVRQPCVIFCDSDEKANPLCSQIMTESTGGLMNNIDEADIKTETPEPIDFNSHSLQSSIPRKADHIEADNSSSVEDAHFNLSVEELTPQNEAEIEVKTNNSNVPNESFLCENVISPNCSSTNNDPSIKHSSISDENEANDDDERERFGRFGEEWENERCVECEFYDEGTIKSNLKPFEMCVIDERTKEDTTNPYPHIVTMSSTLESKMKNTKDDFAKSTFTSCCNIDCGNIYCKNAHLEQIEKNKLHINTLQWDHHIYCSQLNLRESMISNLCSLKQMMKKLIRCCCSQCERNYDGLLENCKLLALHKYLPDNIKKSRDVETLKNIKVKDAYRGKNRNTVQLHSTLPLKKRKSFKCNGYNDSELSYPATPMMSIASLEPM